MYGLPNRQNDLQIKTHRFVTLLSTHYDKVFSAFFIP